MCTVKRRISNAWRRRSAKPPEIARSASTPVYYKMVDDEEEEDRLVHQPEIRTSPFAARQLHHPIRPAIITLPHHRPLIPPSLRPESVSSSAGGTFYLDDASTAPGTPRGNQPSSSIEQSNIPYFRPLRRYSHDGTMTEDNDYFASDEEEDDVFVDDNEGNQQLDDPRSLYLRSRPSTSSYHSAYSFPGTLSSTSTLPVQSVAQSYYSGSTLYYPEGDPRANELGEHAYIPPGERSITTRADFEDSQRAAQRPRGPGSAEQQRRQRQQQRRRMVVSLAALRLTPTPSSASRRGRGGGHTGADLAASASGAPRLTRLPLRSAAAEDEYHSFMYGERRGTYSGRGGRHRDL